MDIIPQNYPVVNYILSRIPSMKSPRSEVDIEQPRPETTSTQEAQFVDPLVERMPHLKDPKVVAEMTKAVLEISQTRSVLRALGDRPDHETVDKAKEKVAEIESNLTNQLEEIVLSPRPNDVEQNDWRSMLTDKEQERRDAAEKEKAMYKAMIRVDEMHAEYEKLLKDAELRLMKIYDSAAARREEGEGLGKDIDASDGEDKAECSRSKELVDEEVVEILKADAAGKQIDMVNLSGRCLKILPEAFGRITSLVSLNLSDNQLECLPDSIAGLEHLQELNLSSNILESLPDSIGLLVNLKVLNVSGNKLNALPDSICHCRSLVELDASFNDLTYLPTYLGQEMVCLRRLSVQYNKLHTLPTSIGGMKSLQHLDVHFNELHGLPTCIGVLTNLETLNLSGNFCDLGSLPETFGELINLKELDLSNNQIHELPSTFGRLENLVKLNLELNPITIPPLEVVSEGVEAVREYMSQRWINLLVEEEERNAQKMKEEAETTGWLRNSFSKSTSWLKRSLSSVSDYLVSPDGPSKDPCLDQQL